MARESSSICVEAADAAKDSETQTYQLVQEHATANTGTGETLYITSTSNTTSSPAGKVSIRLIENVGTSSVVSVGPEEEDAVYCVQPACASQDLGRGGIGEVTSNEAFF